MQELRIMPAATGNRSPRVILETSGNASPTTCQKLAHNERPIIPTRGQKDDTSRVNLAARTCHSRCDRSIERLCANSHRSVSRMALACIPHHASWRGGDFLFSETSTVDPFSNRRRHEAPFRVPKRVDFCPICADLQTQHRPNRFRSVRCRTAI